MLVEGAASNHILAAERLAVALDRIDIAARRVAERAQVVRHDPPAAGHGDVRVVECSHEWRHDVAGGLHARIEQDHHRSRRPADADVRRSGVTEPLARPDRLDRESVGRLRGPQLVERGVLGLGRSVGDDHHRRPSRRTGTEPSQGPREVVRPVGGHQDHGRHAHGRIGEPGWHART